jgi:hypothetical protein
LFEVRDRMNGYYGKITPGVYAAALHLRGDDDCCWEETVPLADPPLVFGPDFPEEADGDQVIAIWEAALAEARKEFCEGRFVLESVTLYLEENPNLNLGELVWEKNVKLVQRK